MQKTLLTFIAWAFILITVTKGQISQKGMPIGLTERFLEQHQADDVPTVKVPIYDHQIYDRVQKKHPNFVFDGSGVDVNINLENSGEWMLMEDGSRMWRTEIVAEGAASLTLLYDDFWLPADAKFYVYTPDERMILGAFTNKNNKKSGKFSTATTPGERVILEYYEPPKVNSTPRISVNKVIQQLPKGRSRGEFGFDSSADCHLNINCDQGARFQTEKRGVVRIVMFLEGDEGTFLGYCSGALMNNTAQDQTPYLLTAFHCIVEGFSPLYDQWQFNFGYEAPSCDNPSTEPIPKTIIGAEQVAGRQDPDFLLVKIASSIPSSFNPYYNGWNRGTTALPTKSGMIHHPCGDIKKISIDNNNTVKVNPRNINWTEYVSSPNSHFELQFDEGFSQVGASGSPLFGEDGLIYGQLHGGNINLASCEVIRLYFGRLATSWEADSINGRLKEWLDPLNTGQSILEGFDPFGGMANFTGLLQTPTGEGIGGVSINIAGDTSTTEIMTDENGQFSIQLPRTSDYRLTFSKSTNPLNGVTTFDIVKIRRHILGLELFNDTFKEVAADVNISNSITTFDMIEIQKLILGITKAFPNAPSWGFVSPEGNLFNILTLNDLQQQVNLNIIGLKIGDVNNSADAKN